MYVVIKMIDGFIVYQIVKNLNKKIKTGRIQKIYQLNENEILFKIHAHHNKYQMITSIDAHDFRVSLTDKKYVTPQQATNFTMLLRKHLEGGIIESIEQVGFDRIIIIKVNKRNELKDLKSKYLIIELLGRHANLILCDEDKSIMQTQKKVPYSINQQRLSQPKLMYEPPQQDKTNPLDGLKPTKDYQATYQGFSQKMSDYFAKSKNSQKTFDKMLADSTIYLDGKNLTVLKTNYKSLSFPNIDEAFAYLENQVQQTRIKQAFQEPIKQIKQRITKNERKLSKLAETYQKNQNYEQDQYYGTLIFDNLYLFDPNDHLSEIKVHDYNRDEDVKIKLNKKLTIKENAQAYLKKYHKQKTSLQHLQNQIKVAEQDKQILTLALDQLSFAELGDAQEIIDELVKMKLLPKRNNHKEQVKKKNKKPQYETYRYQDTTIYVGKNNLQNDYVTFKLARKNDTWLHIHGYAGAHVVIASPDVNDDTLRVAAMLAIKYSSVADKTARYQVDYTLVKNVKKMSGPNLGQVTLREQQTIEIAIDDKLLAELVKED